MFRRRTTYRGKEGVSKAGLGLDDAKAEHPVQPRCGGGLGLDLHEPIEQQRTDDKTGHELLRDVDWKVLDPQIQFMSEVQGASVFDIARELRLSVQSVQNRLGAATLGVSAATLGVSTTTLGVSTTTPTLVSTATSPVSAATTPVTLPSSATTAKIELVARQQEVVDAILSGKSVFFTGSAGTGKSYVLRHVLQHAKLDPNTTFVTAPSGLAAVNIGGTTVHWWAGIGLGKGRASTLANMVRRNKEAFDRWKRCRTLVIDEISMLSGVLFERLEEVARRVRGSKSHFGGIQLVLCGDFFQLPPVERNPDGSVDFCFLTQAWARCVQVSIELNAVFRQSDVSMVAMLNEIRRGICTDSTHATLSAIVAKTVTSQTNSESGIAESTRLYPHNADAERENRARLAKLSTLEYAFVAIDKGDERARKMLEHCRARRRLLLKVGAQVILLKNIDPKQGLVNGSRGIIIDFQPVDSASTRFPKVRFHSFSGEKCIEICIMPASFEVRSGMQVLGTRTQLPLALGWACSIHGAQGMTLDRATLALANCFEYGQVYVALSRVRSWEGLALVSYLRDRIRANPAVLQFYDTMCQTLTAIPTDTHTDKSAQVGQKRMRAQEVVTGETNRVVRPRINEVCEEPPSITDRDIAEAEAFEASSAALDSGPEPPDEFY